MAYWINVENYICDNGIIYTDASICSECKTAIFHGFLHKECPECKAKMNEEPKYIDLFEEGDV